MTDFHERQEARRLRYLARAKKARADAQARFHSRAAQELEQAAGSPILIGHHSEGRHRRLFERRRREMRAGFALQKKAEHYERRAKSIGKGRIATEDPDAVALLTAKLKAAESQHPDSGQETHSSGQARPASRAPRLRRRARRRTPARGPDGK